MKSLPRFLLTWGVLCNGLTPLNAATTPKKPVNLLFIMTDQQRFDAMSCAGNTILKTPNMDKLASEGVRFVNCYSACPVCVPARTAILTGHSPESNQVVDNRDAEKTDAPAFPSFDQVLLRSGYRGEYHGKYHSPYQLAVGYSEPVRWLNGKKAPEGCKVTVSEEANFQAYLREHLPQRALSTGQLQQKGGPYTPIPLDENYGKEHPTKGSQAEAYGRQDVPAEHSLCAFTAREGIEALDRLKGGPFTLTISFDPPHPPMIVPEPYFSKYAPEKLPGPKVFSLENSPYQGSPDAKLDPRYRDTKNIQGMTSVYYGMVSEVDDWLGKILTRLKELGLEENTLVIFTSDHGEMLGEHGLHGKAVFYEPAVHVPLIMRMPGVIPANTMVRAPVTHLDLFSTILDFCNRPGHESEGESLRALIERKQEDKGRMVVSEWNSKRFPAFMICDGHWKLMYGATPQAPSLDALYDLQKDPSELNNLIGKNPDRETYRAEVDRLKGSLVAWLERVKSPSLQMVKARPTLTADTVKP